MGSAPFSEGHGGGLFERLEGSADRDSVGWTVASALDSMCCLLSMTTPHQTVDKAV